MVDDYYTREAERLSQVESVYCEVRGAWNDNCRNIVRIEVAEAIGRRFEAHLTSWLSGILDQETMFQEWDRFEDDITQLQIPGRNGPDEELVARCDRLFDDLRATRQRSNAFLRANNALLGNASMACGDDPSSLRRYVFGELLRAPHADTRLPVSFDTYDLG